MICNNKHFFHRHLLYPVDIVRSEEQTYNEKWNCICSFRWSVFLAGDCATRRQKRSFTNWKLDRFIKTCQRVCGYDSESKITGYNHLCVIVLVNIAESDGCQCVPFYLFVCLFSFEVKTFVSTFSTIGEYTCMKLQLKTFLFLFFYRIQTLHTSFTMTRSHTRTRLVTDGFITVRAEGVTRKVSSLIVPRLQKVSSFVFQNLGIVWKKWNE